MFLGQIWVESEAYTPLIPKILGKWEWPISISRKLRLSKVQIWNWFYKSWSFSQIRWFFWDQSGAGLCVWRLIWLLWGIEASVAGIGDLRLFWFERIKSHVLWCSGVGSLANCCPDYLSPMLILSNSWSVLGDSCRDSRFSDESRVLLRLLDAYRRDGHRLVRHYFVRSQCACRVRNPGHNFPAGCALFG